MLCYFSLFQVSSQLHAGCHPVAYTPQGGGKYCFNFWIAFLSYAFVNYN